MLELRTRKGNARVVVQLAIVLLLTAVTAAVVATAGSGAAHGADARRLSVAWLAGIAGRLMLVIGALRLPAWARVRARQFDALATFARRIDSAPNAG